MSGDGVDVPSHDRAPSDRDRWRDDDVIGVVTTVGSTDAARHIGRDLVERRLAACAQMTPIESVYVWDGVVHDDREVRLLVKTVAARFDAVVQAIRERHPYALPAIHAQRLERVDAPYADWVRARSTGERAAGTSSRREGVE